MNVTRSIITVIECMALFIALTYCFHRFFALLEPSETTKSALTCSNFYVLWLKGIKWHIWLKSFTSTDRHNSGSVRNDHMCRSHSLLRRTTVYIWIIIYRNLHASSIFGENVPTNLSKYINWLVSKRLHWLESKIRFLGCTIRKLYYIHHPRRERTLDGCAPFIRRLSMCK